MKLIIFIRNLRGIIKMKLENGVLAVCFQPADVKAMRRKNLGEMTLHQPSRAG